MELDYQLEFVGFYHKFRLSYFHCMQDIFSHPHKLLSALGTASRCPVCLSNCSHHTEKRKACSCLL